jgi:hypothetical protein
MPYRVKTNDFVIEMDSTEELKSILDLLGLIPDKSKSRTAPPLDNLAFLSMGDKLKKFYAGMVAAPGLMRKTIEGLVPHPEGLTDAALREILRLQTNSALAGIMAGISKRAEKAGLSREDIVLKEDVHGKEGVLYCYRLTGTMREFMESKEPVRRANPAPAYMPLVRQTNADGA